MMRTLFFLPFDLFPYRILSPFSSRESRERDLVTHLIRNFFYHPWIDLSSSSSGRRHEPNHHIYNKARKL